MNLPELRAPACLWERGEVRLFRGAKIESAGSGGHANKKNNGKGWWAQG